MWNSFQVPIIIFPLLLFFIGIDRQRLKQPVVSIGMSTLILMLIGYFFVYVNTPYDIGWHLETSLVRLYVQLWPSFVFVTMFMVQNFQWSDAPLEANNLNELADGTPLRSNQ
jgi:formate hydrogenlyase subunit 3/multisubunit Na+/H+ antiporter MnhD subunit